MTLSDPRTPVATGPSLADLLARAGAAVVAERRRRAAEHGTSATALAVLVLARDDGLAQRELAARAGVAPATLTPVLDALTECGDVVRARDPDDRRVQRVALTARGRGRLHAASAAAGPGLPDLPEGHAAAVREYLVAVIARLEQDRPVGG